jgi:hypothetical protein
MLRSGQLAKVKFDSIPLWASDVGIGPPCAYLELGDLIILVELSDKVGAEYWLVVTPEHVGYVYAFNIQPI